MKKVVNVAMIGGGFMGKAHSNAWKKVNTFFDAPFRVNLRLIVGNRTPLEAFAENWGYEEVSYDWRTAVAREDIDIVDIGTPPYLHREMAIEAARHGKHIVCEKPCGMSYAECMEMAQAAQAAGVVHYLNHNYRRVPAVALAKRMIDEGRLGRIYHWRGAYLQDWLMDERAPLKWNLREEYAGAGALYDLGSHAVDLARYLIGEPVSVTAQTQTFVARRPLGRSEATDTMPTGAVTVDDAAFMLLSFENGALGSIDVSRYAGGRKNYNDFEIYGSRGSLKFNFERMNELQFSDLTLPLEEQGYRTILVTEKAHPYISAWWPGGHIIGYEHSFVNAFYDFLCAIDSRQAIAPNLLDGAADMRVLQAAKLSAAEGRCVAVSEIR